MVWVWLGKKMGNWGSGTQRAWFYFFEIAHYLRKIMRKIFTNTFRKLSEVDKTPWSTNSVNDSHLCYVNLGSKKLRLPGKWAASLILIKLNLVPKTFWLFCVFQPKSSRNSHMSYLQLSCTRQLLPNLCILQCLE